MVSNLHISDPPSGRFFDLMAWDDGLLLFSDIFLLSVLKWNGALSYYSRACFGVALSELCQRDLT